MNPSELEVRKAFSNNKDILKRSAKSGMLVSIEGSEENKEEGLVDVEIVHQSGWRKIKSWMDMTSTSLR